LEEVETRVACAESNGAQVRIREQIPGRIHGEQKL
jgi:hypothetical protein